MARVAVATRYLAVINFTALILGMIFLGGDALNGHIANGHHYLSWHGQLTEVSPYFGTVAFTPFRLSYFSLSELCQRWFQSLVPF